MRFLWCRLHTQIKKVIQTQTCRKFELKPSKCYTLVIARVRLLGTLDSASPPRRTALRQPTEVLSMSPLVDASIQYD